MVTLAGLVTSSVRKIGKKSQKPYLVVDLEDFDSSLQFMLAGGPFEQYGEMLKPDQIVAVRGIVTVRDELRSLRVLEVSEIEAGAEGQNRVIEIRIQDRQAGKENLERLDRILTMHPGFSSVTLHMHTSTGIRTFMLPKQVSYTSAFAAEIKGLFGAGALSRISVAASGEELLDEAVAGDDVASLEIEQGSLFES